MPKYLGDNDISVTKFLDRSVGKFLSANDITVTKFLEDKDDNDISVTKFLQDSENYFPVHHSQRAYYMPPNRRYDHDPDLGWDTDQHHYYPKESYFQYDHEHARSVYPREYLDNPHYYDRATTVYPPDYTKPHQMNKTAPGQKKDKQSKKHKPKKTKSEKDAKD